MTTRDREILDKITLQIMKIRGINPPEDEKNNEGENKETMTPGKIKSIPLGTYINIEGNDKS